MVDIPSRAAMNALVDSAKAIVPAMAVGFARMLGDERVSVVYTYPYGFSEYVLEPPDVTEVLDPSGDRPRFADRSVSYTHLTLPTKRIV